MQLEVVRCVTDWLRRPDARGLNAKLAGVLRDVDHAGPVAVSLITCPFDPGADGSACAEWKEPGSFPAIYITPDGPVTAFGEVATTTRASDRVAVAIRYLARGNDGRSRVEAAYVARAVVKSLREMLKQDVDALAGRTRNEVTILNASAMTWGPWLESVGTAQAVAVVGAEFTVRDRDP